MKKVRRERTSAMLVLALMRILSRHADGRSWTVAQDGSGDFAFVPTRNISWGVLKALYR